jgi:hypothetical protein
MKKKLTILILLLTSLTAACSLTEDITPPPNTQFPTLQETITRQSVNPTESPEVSPTTSVSTAVSTGVPAAPDGFVGNISGSINHPSGTSIPGGQTVKLVGYDQNESGGYQKALELDASVNTDGSYVFRDIAVPLERAFLLFTTWEDVEYQSDPLIISTSSAEYPLSINVFGSTNDPKSLQFDQVHLIFGVPSQESIPVTGLFVVTNTGEKAIKVATDGTSVPFINLPEAASDVKFQLSQSSAELMIAAGGFAMLPGVDRQYGFIASFNLPYKKSLKYDQTFSLDVSSLTVFIPQGMRLKSEQLTESDTQVIQSQTYQKYQSDDQGLGSSLSLKLSGAPGGTSGLKFDRQTLVLIGIGVVGLLLVGVGGYLFYFDRARAKKQLEMVEAEIEPESPAEDREALMDAILSLDDQFEAGTIPENEYQDRRKELIERLKKN